MQGEILGYSIEYDEGVIVCEQNRYNFTKKDWKEDTLPQKGDKVDFVAHDRDANDIYLLEKNSDSSLTLLAILSLLMTLFLGFIGTAISRVAISNHTFHQAIIPIAVHAVITLCLAIPLLGTFIYLVGTIYFMVTNYKYVYKPRMLHKYE
ncbi:MAG: hypothetical protein ACQESH_03115 [Campylobacterota bacterium]